MGHALDHVLDLTLHREHKQRNEIQEQNRPKNWNVEKAEESDRTE